MPNVLWQKPMPASFISVWDEQNLIYANSPAMEYLNGTAISEWKIDNYTDFAGPLVQEYAQGIESNDTGEGVPTCRVLESPSDGLLLNENYRKENLLYVVVCYWRESLVYSMNERIGSFM